MQFSNDLFELCSVYKGTTPPSTIASFSTKSLKNTLVDLWDRLVSLLWVYSTMVGYFHHNHTRHAAITGLSARPLTPTNRMLELERQHPACCTPGLQMDHPEWTRGTTLPGAVYTWAFSVDWLRAGLEKGHNGSVMPGRVESTRNNVLLVECCTACLHYGLINV